MEKSLKESLFNNRKAREEVSKGMLETYTREVPLFGLLNRVVKETNEEFVKASDSDPEKKKKLAGSNLKQLGEIRHAAIRLALPEEMEMFVRVMNHLGQFPVGYYDLTGSGTPVQSTVLRPIHDDEIQENAFTIFSSMLDFKALDFSSDPELKKIVRKVLDERKSKHFRGEGIFTKRLIELVEKAEDFGLNEEERKEYVNEVVDIFQLNDTALVDKKTYERIKKISPVAADIIGAGLNINHLTPDTPDISAVYEKMKEESHPVTGEPVVMNGFIYGPKGIDILLEQTSFKAVKIKMNTPDGKEIEHQARFGEVESRGMAITRTGREIYDEVLKKINTEINEERENFKNELEERGEKYANESRDEKESELGEKYIERGKKIFPNSFPKTDKELALQGLAYFKYSLNDNAPSKSNPEELKKALSNIKKIKISISEKPDQQELITQKVIPLMEALVELGSAERKWIKYRDFLPASAAGIFSSNRDEDGAVIEDSDDNIASWFMKDVGVIDFYDLYEASQAKSIYHILKKLEEERVSIENTVSNEVLNALEKIIEIGDATRLVEKHRNIIIKNLREKHLKSTVNLNTKNAKERS